MNNYVSPSVFVESKGSANVPIESVSASTGCFIGITPWGSKTPTLVSSWQEFIDIFAPISSSPFISNSYLSHAVYGFFQNGGKKCYIARVVPESAVSASLKVENYSGTITAKYRGSAGNNLSIAFGKISEGNVQEGTAKAYITIEANGEVLEKFFVSVTNPQDSDYYANIFKKSAYIEVTGPSFSVNYTNLAEKTFTFSGGDDGQYSTLSDSEYSNAIKELEVIDDINLISAPGESSEAILNLLLEYADKKNAFAILDGSPYAHAGSIDSTITKVNTLTGGKNGAFYNTYIKIVDPNSNVKALMDCPPCGHIMGMYARIIQERGVWKAPAGTEAVLKGALGVYQISSQEQIDNLNRERINVITNKPNYGIVVWGAKSLNKTDPNLSYVSDILLNTNIKESIRQATQWAVFEPNNSVLWTKLATTIEAFMDGLYRAGAFYGSEAKEAYYVKCDEELNTEAVRNAGQVICEVGYAANKPAEFVVIRIAHSINA